MRNGNENMIIMVVNIRVSSAATAGYKNPVGFLCNLGRNVESIRTS